MAHTTLVLQLKRIGDAVLTAPALAALRAAEPDSRIVLLLSGSCAQLGPLFPMVDAVWAWQPGRLNLRLIATIIRQKWHRVLDFTGNDRSAFLTLLSTATQRIGYAKFATNRLRQRAWNTRCAASVRDLTTLAFHHALISTALPHAPATPESGHLAKPTLPPHLALPSRYLLIHPGTAREEKYWLVTHWATVIKEATAQGWRVVITGGTDPFERAHLAALHTTGAVYTDLAGQLTLLDFAAVVGHATAVLSVDTGAMHLAAAYGIPQVCLFGPTNPYHWAPRHPHAIILHGPHTAPPSLTPKSPRHDMSEIQPATVIAAIEKQFSS